MLTGTIFGFFFYKNQTSLSRMILAKVLINLLLNLLLNSLWLHILYNQAFWAMIPGRVLKNIGLLPIEVLLMWLVLPRLAKLSGSHSLRA
jgi:ECF transporter S component (folate family)